jgi:hypothetical protein
MELDLSDLISGVYFIKVKHPGLKEQSRRIVVSD